MHIHGVGLLPFFALVVHTLQPSGTFYRFELSNTSTGQPIFMLGWLGPAMRFSHAFGFSSVGQGGSGAADPAATKSD